MTYKLVLLASRPVRVEREEPVHRRGSMCNLTDKGRAEAQRGGELLAERGILPDVVHTSLQRRAINTANIALDAAGPPLDSRQAHLAPERASLRRPAG